MTLEGKQDIRAKIKRQVAHLNPEPSCCVMTGFTTSKF